MRRLLNYFVRGLLLLTPPAITLYLCWTAFRFIDGWLGLPFPGVGVVAVVAFITLFGFLAGNFLARSILDALEHLMQRVPLVRLLYTSTKDLLSAFVGEKRRFDKPVLVELFPGSDARAFGFITQEALEQLGLADHVAVYFPQSYNFAGNLVIFPNRQVRRLEAESAAVMAFIVSGGVTDVPRHSGSSDAGGPTGGGAPAVPTVSTTHAG